MKIMISVGGPAIRVVQSTRISGLSIRYKNPPVLAGGCSVFGVFLI